MRARMHTASESGMEPGRPTTRWHGRAGLVLVDLGVGQSGVVVEDDVDEAVAHQRLPMLTPGATPVAGTTQSPAIEGPQALAPGRR